MKLPPALQPGDTIGLAAPSRFINEDQIRDIAEFFASKGFQTYVDPALTCRHFQFAGTDQERANLFNRLIHHPEVKAIWCMRGGYGAGRILPLIDFNFLASNPKWVLGFSDITAIHSALLRHNVACIHAPLATTLAKAPQEAINRCFDILSGEVNENLHPLPLNEARARVVGGNLSVIASLMGTPWFEIQQGDILLLEDIDEMLYHIDRMMNNLSLSGALQKVSAIWVGYFSQMRDSTKEFGFSSDNPFGMDALQIIKSHAAVFNIPCFEVPVGHEDANYPVILG
jgi:muramoyltetrapeptide carboxypeptidase